MTTNTATIPTFTALRQTIKKAGKRWKPDLGLLLLVKYECFSGSTAAFAEKLGINVQRVAYWQKSLKWNKVRDKTMLAFNPAWQGNDPTEVKRSAATNSLPLVTYVGRPDIKDRRAAVETIVHALREMSTQFKDAEITKSTNEACGSLSKVLHRMLDIELGNVNAIIQSHHHTNGKSTVAEA